MTDDALRDAIMRSEDRGFLSIPRLKGSVPMSDRPVNVDLDLHIAKLDLQPGDILVVKCGGHLSMEALDRLREALAIVAPNTRTLILEPEWDIAVISDPSSR